ncbi:uncharacterized protein LOC131680495 [Topomyia yanbarensis]|uniref:uncharacterized protein LOC131680495 n=1 Tax=Topomyia yanbarensis TaxID=2498891 RepID=UPI00273AB8DB|nr:uncharacterized protein LOC131680495 [Topomyia yanbarensis]
MQERFQHLRGLPLESYHNVSPRLLIGLDHAGLGYAKESREGKTKEPIAVKTRLGWAVYGSCVGEEKAFRYVNYHSLQVCQCNLEIDGALYKAVKNYFTLDSLGIHTPGKPMLSTEDQRAQTLLETLTRPKNGRFESSLLWKYDNVRLPDSEGMALRRWRCLDSRLRKDPILAEILTTKIDDHITKGYIRKLTVEELRLPHTRVWYLPIFPVDNPNKPGKTRLVWDAAATAHGISLNSVLLKGPDQLTSLLTVLIQFREYKTAVCGDIREMYHQVQIREDDQHCQRFFWKDKPEDLHPSVYIMMVMTFGARCSPSTAQYIKNHNAERFQQDYPAAVHAITKQHYVDDMLVSVESEKEALQIANDVRMIHAKAGFEMRNWISNSANVQAEAKNLSIGDENATEKVLGMWWDTVTDHFTYKLSARYAQDLLSGHQRPTKREVPRMLMMIFDPLGIIAHFLMFLKVLLQEIWRSGIGWDDPIEDVHFEKWLLWLSVLPQVTSVRIPRCYRVQTSLAADTEVQMHAFVDASENGFAAVIYLRFRQGDIIECAQVGAKTKVALQKFLSIPRSELQAAVIGMRLAETITKSLSFEVIKRFFWTDSRDVIYWLNSDHRRYSQFVAFRVSEILDATNADEWYWIGTKLNVADEGTKWKGTPNLDASSRWFRGPEFLWFPEREWPKSPKLVESSTVEELRPHLLLHVASCEPVIEPLDFPGWKILLRRVAYVLRYIGNLKRSVKKKNLICGPLIKQEFVKAEYYLFRLAQSFAYADEIAILMRNRSLEGPKREISRNSALFNKCVVLDENDVLRIRGRAQNSPFILHDAANPIVLPRDHHITRLIIADVHNRFNHQNHQTIINELRQRYRIPRLKATYNNIRRECQQCKIDGANPQPPAMCDLPPQRLAVFARPFTHMGIDYFGPMLVSVGRRTEKRRGIPAVIYSDRGTNFQGTSKELQTAILNLNHDQLAKEFTSSHTQWYFIPPASPHMGGAWERLIRSVKQNLHKIKTSRLPTDEVLENMLLEVENIINSRPLTDIPVDDDESPVLTPNHFLLGSSNGLKSWVPYIDNPIVLRNSWQQSQHMANDFWRQWLRDYLPTIGEMPPAVNLPYCDSEFPCDGSSSIPTIVFVSYPLRRDLLDIIPSSGSSLIMSHPVGCQGRLDDFMWGVTTGTSVLRRPPTNASTSTMRTSSRWSSLLHGDRSTNILATTLLTSLVALEVSLWEKPLKHQYQFELILHQKVVSRKKFQSSADQIVHLVQTSLTGEPPPYNPAVFFDIPKGSN